MFEMLYDKQSKLSSIKLPFTLSDFTIPYNVNESDLKELLKKRDEFGPPEHMYV